MTNLYSLIVQFRLGGWGSEQDLNKCHRLEILLDQSLIASQNGVCDGNDIGSGTMNLYLENVGDVSRACEAIIATLTKAQALEGAIVAECHQVPREDHPEEYDITGYTVLWPTDYQGTFDII